MSELKEAAWQVLDRVTAARKNLLAAGYNLTPTNGKRPFLDGWQNIQTTEAEIERWAREYPNALNTGLQTRNTPGVDIDVLDEAVAEELQELLWSMIGGSGRPLVRYGRRPKRAVLFQTNEPFDKLSTPFFVSPDGRKHRVEVLCDGQQFIAHGTHPDTGMAYVWEGGEPTSVPRDDLPHLAEETAKEFVAKAAEVMRAHGWIVEEKKKKNGDARKMNGGGGVTEFDSLYGGREQKWAAAAISDLAAELAGMAPETGRNERLYRAAFRMGTMTVRGWIDRATVEGRLLDACKVNALENDTGADAVRASLKSGLDGGETVPHEDLPDTPAGGNEPKQGGVRLEDFRAYMPLHSYVFTPCREMWPASSVNARIPPQVVLDANGNPVLKDDGTPLKIPANAWLDRNRPVEQMVWSPGRPMLIENKLMADGGWFDRAGVTCFNLYRPPALELGNAAEADPWLEHIHKVFGADADHIVQYLAHRVQRPAEKINHALVLGGAQGIGKDTLLEPVKMAIGPWNFQEIGPQQLLGRFNAFVRSVILRISEARDLGDINRYQFYDHLKVYTAAPPDVLRCDEKHLREHSVLNCCGVIITTNHKSDGIYLPADDRRHYVAWSDLTKNDFTTDYWNRMWGWYANGGIGHAAAYLTDLNISKFDPKAPPPKTAAFWAIVDAGRAPEDGELADVLEHLGNPSVTTLVQIARVADGDFALWINERKNRRVIPHRLEACGYVPVRNEAAADGMWKVGGKRQVIYARADLTVQDRIRAASRLKG